MPILVRCFLLILFFQLMITQGFAEQETRILFLGDSLSEGLGVDEASAFPRVVERILREKKKNVSVINGGVSGSTSASGLSRLKWHLKNRVDIMVLELGANDGLRGIKIVETQKNLENIIHYAKEQKIKVLLMGLLMPPNYGKDYTTQFEKMYQTIAKKEKIPLLPDWIKKTAGNRLLNQADGIHPNAKGHEIIAEDVGRFILKNL